MKVYNYVPNTVKTIDFILELIDEHLVTVEPQKVFYNILNRHALRKNCNKSLTLRNDSHKIPVTNEF